MGVQSIHFPAEDVHHEFMYSFFLGWIFNVCVTLSELCRAAVPVIDGDHLLDFVQFDGGGQVLPERLVPIPESRRDRPYRGAGNGELAVLAPEIAGDIHVIVHLIDDARINAGKHHRIIGAVALAFGWPGLRRYRLIHDVTLRFKKYFFLGSTTPRIIFAVLEVSNREYTADFFYMQIFLDLNRPKKYGSAHPSLKDAFCYAFGLRLIKNKGMKEFADAPAKENRYQSQSRVPF